MHGASLRALRGSLLLSLVETRPRRMAYHTRVAWGGYNNDGETSWPGKSGGIGQLSMSQMARSSSPSSTDTAISAQIQAAHASTKRARILGATWASSRKAASS